MSIPEGATHQWSANGLFTKQCPDETWAIWQNNQWLWIGDEFGGEMIEIKKQPKAWSGPEDGLPPAGFPCEAELYKGGGWIEGFVAYYGKAHFIFESSQLTVGVEISGKIRTSAFRPIRTPEQLAAEERERGVEEMWQVVKLRTNIESALYDLYDAGFKREVK